MNKNQTNDNITAKILQELLVWAVLYIGVVTCSNLGSLRVVALWGLTLDGGALLYPFCFTLRDLLHKKGGAAVTRRVIWLTAGLNLALFAFAAAVAALPAAPSAGAQEAYGQVLAPGMRLVLASVISNTVSELVDTDIYARVKARLGSRRQWLRVGLSNLISIPLDTALFTILAFAGRYDWPTLLGLFWANLGLKYAVSVLSLGGIYLVRDDRD